MHHSNRLARATALSAALLATTAQGSPVISEVLYDAAGSDAGAVFVELYGAPGTVLDGLALVGVNGSGGADYQTVPLTGAIPDDGIFLIADGDEEAGVDTTVPWPDLITPVDFQNGPDSIQLRDGSTVLDALAYGDFSGAVFAGEGTPAPDAGAGESLARWAANVDTDDNAADFALLGTPTPGTAPLAAVPLPAPLGLMLGGLSAFTLALRRRV